MPRIPDYRSISQGVSTGRVVTATDGRDVLFNDPDGWEIDQPWRWWDGDTPSNPNAGNTWGNPIPGAEFAGGYLGHALPVVDRCLQLTADKIAGMPWKTYRGRTRFDTPSWIADPQALARDGRRVFIGTMDVRFSAVEFWATYIRSLTAGGRGDRVYAASPRRGRRADRTNHRAVLHPQPAIRRDRERKIRGRERRIRRRI